MKKLIFGLLLLSTTAFAEQGQLNLSIGGYTDHMGNTQYYSGGKKYTKNDFNWGGGLEYEVIDNLLIQGGVYQNSVDQTSASAGVQYNFLKLDQFKFGVQEQWANGYSLQTTAWNNKTKKQQVTGTTNNNQYRTNIVVCYDLGLDSDHSPSVCAKSNFIQSSGNAFSQISFTVKVPLTNLLN